MTPDELTDLINNGPTERLIAALGPLTETERKKLSKTVVALRKQNVTRDVGPFYHQQSPKILRLKLALFAVGPLAEAQRIRLWHIVSVWEHKQREPLFQVISDRRPEWLLQWVVKELEERDSYPDWQFLRRLIREGICPKPQTEAYILKSLLISIHFFEREKSLKQKLLEDPELLSDEVWRIFELNPTRGTILPGTDITNVSEVEEKGLKPNWSWGMVLRDLCREGKLERARLLVASLHGLIRNREARNTIWFCKFHELLEPSTEERRTLQPTYLQLLCHAVPGVAETALNALAILEKEKLLDQAAFLDAAGPVFHLQPKVQPLALIKLLGRLATSSTELAPRIAEVSIAGLSHPAPQVQEAILQLLTKLSDRAGDVIAASLPSQIETIAPSLQDQARKLLAGIVPDVPTPVNVPDASPFSEVLDEASKVPSPWREAAGIDTLLQAIESSGELSPIHFDPMVVPHLRAEDRVRTIQTLDELIERLTVAVEGLDDAIEFELLVDGLSRLCDQRPNDFRARVAPMLARIRKLSPTIKSAIVSAGLRFALFKLILNWCDGVVYTPREDRNSIFGFLDVRLGLVSVRIRDKQPAPLLACPTHRQGWIDPAEMAARLQTYQQRELEPAKHDFIQGVLRLAPDGRGDTLAGAGGLRGKYAAAFRYALGGPLEDTSLPGAVLIAAGRARMPRADLTELSFIKDIDGPDALRPARYSWDVNSPGPEGEPHLARLHLSVDPGTPSPDKVRDVPTVLLHPCKPLAILDWEGQTGLQRWQTTIWPSNLDSCFALGARMHFDRDFHALLEPLLDPGVPFSEMAQLLLALSLNEQAPGVTSMSVDVLVDLIRDGRCVGAELGRVLGRMMMHGQLKLNRLGKHLDTAARASLLHTHVCAQVVQRSCSSLDELPRDAHFILGPLLEWLSSLEQSVLDECRPLLDKAKSGRSGALAKKLLQLQSSPTSQTAIRTEALRGRLHVINRWMSTFSANGNH